MWVSVLSGFLVRAYSLVLWSLRQGDFAKALFFAVRQKRILIKSRQKRNRGAGANLNAASAQINTFEQGLLKQAKEAVPIAPTSFKFEEVSLLDVQIRSGYYGARFKAMPQLFLIDRSPSQNPKKVGGEF